MHTAEASLWIPLPLIFINSSSNFETSLILRQYTSCTPGWCYAIMYINFIATSWHKENPRIASSEYTICNLFICVWIQYQIIYSNNVSVYFWLFKESANPKPLFFSWKTNLVIHDTQRTNILKKLQAP